MKISGEELIRILNESSSTVFRSVGDVRYWVVLVTGANADYAAWASEFWPDTLDCRYHTSRCRLFVPEHEPKNQVMIRATEMAARHNLTLQLLCVHELIEETETVIKLDNGAKPVIHQMRETYPILHLADHGLQWPPEEDTTKPTEN